MIFCSETYRHIRFLFSFESHFTFLWWFSLLLSNSCLFFGQGDNGEEELNPTEIDGQFEFQAKDNLPPGGFKL